MTKDINFTSNKSSSRHYCSLPPRFSR